MRTPIDIPGRPFRPRSPRLAIARRWTVSLADFALDVMFGDPTLDELRSLSDRQLADIGLARPDVEAAAFHPRAARPALLARAAELRRRARLYG